MQLLHGDCLELMKSIPDGSVDMVLCDPPYGTTACKWDLIISFDDMWVELNRIIKDGRAILLFGSEPFSSALRMSNLKNYKYDWIWQKTRPQGFLNANKRPLKNYESICVFNAKVYFPQNLRPCEKIIKRPKTMENHNNYLSAFNGGMVKGNYTQKWNNYPKQIIEFANEGQSFHPTQKPVALLMYLIKTYTNEKETVLDFTMGSGSCGVACKNTNRNFIGIEKDDKYFEIAKQRIENGFVQEDVNINENSPLFE